MIVRPSRVWSTLAVLPLIGACADEASSPAGQPGQMVEIQTSPLTLANVAEVCFDLSVYNGDPLSASTDLVWTRSGVCSGQYGNSEGGDIAYVGPCDASVSPGHNYVELVLDTVEVGGGGYLDDQVTSVDGDPDFQNPCPSTRPCVIDFECLPNADVRVPFDLTIMRDAEQGFFDIAVNFDDVFCSGKVDSCYRDDNGVADPTQPIMLLHGAAGREHTAVAAVACTVGPDTFNPNAQPPINDITTELLFTQLVVTCTAPGQRDVVFELDPSFLPGGTETTEVNVGDDTYRLEWALYQGAEGLPCGEATYQVHRIENGRYYYVDGEGNVFYLALVKLEGWHIYDEDGIDLGFDGNTEPKPRPQQGWTPQNVDVVTPLSCNKNYLNVAYNIEDLAAQGLADCSLSFTATAREQGDTTTIDNGQVVGAGSTYGAIQAVDVPLTDATPEPVCSAHALGAAGSLVRADYIGAMSGNNPWFCYGFNGQGSAYPLGTDVGEVLNTRDTAPTYVVGDGLTLALADIGVARAACGTTFAKTDDFAKFLGADLEGVEALVISVDQERTTHVGTLSIRLWGKADKTAPWVSIEADSASRYAVQGQETLALEVAADETISAGTVFVDVTPEWVIGD